jgi:hypothetical protein
MKKQGNLFSLRPWRLCEIFPSDMWSHLPLIMVPSPEGALYTAQATEGSERCIFHLAENAEIAEEGL